jgi:hypothetical protein
LEELAAQLALGLLVPSNEATRLARALGQTPCPCVPVFDQVDALLAHFEVRVSRVALRHACRLDEPHRHKSVSGDVTNRLERVTPEDFEGCESARPGERIPRPLTIIDSMTSRPDAGP